MEQHRFTHTLLIAVVFILLAGMAAPSTPWINTGVPTEAFWINKAFHTKVYDLVVAGDSRVLKGISPAAMEQVLTDLTIFNYGFDHNAYTREYLLALESLVDKTRPHKSILLGISPQSLTLEAAQRNGFLALRQNGRFERFKRRYLAPYLAFFSPYNLYQIPVLLRGIPSFKYYQHHYNDGWVASYTAPEDPLYQIRRYQGRFDNNQVSLQLTRQLLDFVLRWRKEGIKVYALRLPTSPAMLQLENRESGFELDRFVRDFQKAGGIWLNFHQTAYHSYDGSHLREDAAVQLSTEVARKIRRISKKLAGEPRPIVSATGSKEQP